MASNRNVQYVNLGFTTPEQYWREVVLFAYERFRSAPNPVTAIEAAAPAWHVHEWIWHGEHPGESTDRNPDFSEFRKDHLRKCPELAWISDVINASKHRGLRATGVRRLEGEQLSSGAIAGAAIGELAIGEDGGIIPMMIVLNDGTALNFADVLKGVIDYWQSTQFAPKEADATP